MDCWNVLETNWSVVDELQEFWPEALQLNTKFNSPLYNAYPYYMVPAFPPIAEEPLRRFALAGSLFAQSLFQMDLLIDEGGGEKSAQIAGRILGWQFEAYRELHRIFPPESPFWGRFRGFLSEFVDACMRERSVALGREPWSRYTESVAVDVTIRKTGIARTVVAGLAQLSDEERPLPGLLKSINHYNVARQYLDDVCDWRTDLKLGTPTLLLVRLLDARPQFGEAGPSAEHVESLARRVHYEGHARHMLQAVVDHAARGIDAVADLPLDPWREQLQLLSDRAQTTLDDLETAIQRNVTRAGSQPELALRLPEPAGEWQALAWAALGFVTTQWRRGFGEARHIMRFARVDGFIGDRDYQAGDVFQRAVIADTLCDADEVLGGALRPMVEREATYLLDQRLPYGIGGWNYFPGLPDLCPDADDVAQVMQVLLRTGRHEEVRIHTADPLRVLFGDCAHGDGSFETWIIPSEGRTPLEERQAEAARAMWGTGPDVEVVANVLYALSMFDADGFDSQIQRGLDYVEREQHPEGHWMSTWYFGPYYGTYVCLRSLAALRPDAGARVRGRDFVLSTQRPDGGWAAAREQPASDSLSTALALLALRSAVDPASAWWDEGVRESVERALAFLRSTGEPTGGWPASDFIRMDLNRASGGPPVLLAYGSRTISTAYVLKAALAWDDCAGATGAAARAAQPFAAAAGSGL